MRKPALVLALLASFYPRSDFRGTNAAARRRAVRGAEAYAWCKYLSGPNSPAV